MLRAYAKLLVRVSAFRFLRFVPCFGSLRFGVYAGKVKVTEFGVSRPQGPSIQITWVVVEIMVSFWIPSIIRHLILRAPKKGP